MELLRFISTFSICLPLHGVRSRLQNLPQANIAKAGPGRVVEPLKSAVSG
jgi:hypothetical protein